MGATTEGLAVSVQLPPGVVHGIFVKIAHRPVVNTNWFERALHGTVVLALRDLGYKHQHLRIDGRVYRAWVHPECRHPKVELDVQLRESTWDKLP